MVVNIIHTGKHGRPSTKGKLPDDTHFRIDPLDDGRFMLVPVEQGWVETERPFAADFGKNWDPEKPNWAPPVYEYQGQKQIAAMKAAIEKHQAEQQKPAHGVMCGSPDEPCSCQPERVCGNCDYFVSFEVGPFGKCIHPTPGTSDGITSQSFTCPHHQPREEG